MYLVRKKILDEASEPESNASLDIDVKISPTLWLEGAKY
jgi:hypothetical protein